LTSLLCVATAIWVGVSEKDRATRANVAGLLALVVFLLPAAARSLSSSWRLTIALAGCSSFVLACWLLSQRGFGAQVEASFLLLTSLWCIAAMAIIIARRRHREH
jgi:hypothetical protein